MRTSVRARAAVQTAEIAAAVLGCERDRPRGPARVRRSAPSPGSRGDAATRSAAGVPVAWLDGDLDVRVDGGESGAELAARRRTVLEAAGRARTPGESVLGDQPRAERSASGCRSARSRTAGRAHRARRRSTAASSSSSPTVAGDVACDPATARPRRGEALG